MVRFTVADCCANAGRMTNFEYNIIAKRLLVQTMKSGIKIRAVQGFHAQPEREDRSSFWDFLG